MDRNQQNRWIQYEFPAFERRWQEWCAYAYAYKIDFDQTPVPRWYHNHMLYTLSDGKRGFYEREDDRAKNGIIWLMSYMENDRLPDLPPPPQHPSVLGAAFKNAGSILFRRLFGR
jgi:hypothetical protein